MVQGAVYDAVNAIAPKHHRPYLLDRRFSARASKDAAVATAAYGVLRNIVSTVPNILDATWATLLATLATQYANSLAGDSERPVQDAGDRRRERCSRRHDRGPRGRRPLRALAVGAEHRARALVAADGPGMGSRSSTPRRGSAGWTPSSWSRPRSSARPGRTPLASDAGPRSSTRSRDSARSNSTVRTTDQTYIARWWQSTPVSELERGRRATSPHATAWTSPTPPACSRCRT